MMQSRRDSIREVLTGTVTGLVGSWLITIAVLHAVKDPWAASTLTVALCTVWSLVRGYVVRRWFNRPTGPVGTGPGGSFVQGNRQLLADLEANIIRPGEHVTFVRETILEWPPVDKP